MRHTALAAGLLLLLLGTACGRAHPAAAASITTISSSLAPLQDAFNAAASQPRVLLIISPT
ncbi:MAG: hypothetical protein ACRD2D_11080 [Terriglobales bacterium]